jgi:hypothetical protein
LLEGTVRAVVVKVRRVLGQHRGEMAAVEDQDPVQQFAAEGSDPSFGNRVRLRYPHRGAQDARQLGPSRRGAGSMPACLRIDYTVLAAIW